MSPKAAAVPASTHAHLIHLLRRKFLKHAHLSETRREALRGDRAASVLVEVLERLLHGGSHLRPLDGVGGESDFELGIFVSHSGGIRTWWDKNEKSSCSWSVRCLLADGQKTKTRDAMIHRKTLTVPGSNGRALKAFFGEDPGYVCLHVRQHNAEHAYMRVSDSDSAF